MKDKTRKLPKSKYKQGFFIPRHPEKYLGDIDNIIFRSSYELETFEMLDNNSFIIKWGSEIVAIPYMKPNGIDNSGRMKFRPANYFPDLYVEYINSNGELIREIIEIKPLKQTRASRSKNLNTKLQENSMYIINECKWNAAKKWCDERGIKFSIATEKSIFRSKKQ